MQIITVWLLVFNGLGYTDGGNSMMSVDNIASYKDCNDLGTQISNGHRIEPTGYDKLTPRFTCHKVRKIVQ